MGRRKSLAFVGQMRGKAFSILDVSEPSEPEVVYQHEAYEGTRSHKVRILKNQYLVINCERGPDTVDNKFDSGFRILDIRDETTPKEISYTKVRGRGVHRFWIDDDDIAYMPSYVDGFEGRILLLFDLTNVAQPEFVSRWWFPGQNISEGERANWIQEGRSYRAHGPPIRVGDRIYLGYWDGGTLILDGRDKSNISLVSQRNLCPPYGGCTHTVLPVTREIQGRRWLIVTDESMAENCREERKLLWIMDATDERNIVPVSTFGIAGDGFCEQGGRFGPHNLYEGDLSLQNEEAYVTWYSGGVRVIDVSDPYSPREEAYFIPKPDPKKQKVIQTNDVYVDERGLIFLVDRLSAGVHILEKFQ
jgi:hypothetical protein